MKNFITSSLSSLTAVFCFVFGPPMFLAWYVWVKIEVLFLIRNIICHSKNACVAQGRYWAASYKYLCYPSPSLPSRHSWTSKRHGVIHIQFLIMIWLQLCRMLCPVSLSCLSWGVGQRMCICVYANVYRFSMQQLADEFFCVFWQGGLDYCRWNH